MVERAVTYLLDTNAWSDALRGTGNVSRKLSVVPMARVRLAAPVLYELRRGASAPNAPRHLKRAIDQIAASYAIAPFDGEAAEAAAAIGARMTARGRQIHHLDLLIGGIAAAMGATVISRDADMQGIPGVAVESWA